MVVVVRTAILLSCVVTASHPAAAADPLRCTAFMHNQDGSWRSLSEDDVFAESGVVHLRDGERLSPLDRSPKGAIATALNGLCQDQ